MVVYSSSSSSSSSSRGSNHYYHYLRRDRNIIPIQTIQVGSKLNYIKGSNLNKSQGGSQMIKLDSRRIKSIGEGVNFAK